MWVSKHATSSLPPAMPVMTSKDFTERAFFGMFAWLDEIAGKEPLTGHGRSLSPRQQHDLFASFRVPARRQRVSGRLQLR